MNVVLGKPASDRLVQFGSLDPGSVCLFNGNTVLMKIHPIFTQDGHRNAVYLKRGMIANFSDDILVIEINPTINVEQS